MRTRIREVRKSRGVTQKELAKKLKVTHPVLSRYENGYVFPSYKRLKQIADVLDVDISMLVVAVDNEEDDLKETIGALNPRIEVKEKLARFCKEQSYISRCIYEDLTERGEDACIRDYYLDLMKQWDTLFDEVSFRITYEE